MKIYTQIYSKLVLTQFKLMVVLWRFEIATDDFEGTCFEVRGFRGDLDVVGLSTICHSRQILQLFPYFLEKLHNTQSL